MFETQARGGKITVLAVVIYVSSMPPAAEESRGWNVSSLIGMRHTTSCSHRHRSGEVLAQLLLRLQRLGRRHRRRSSHRVRFPHARPRVGGRCHAASTWRDQFRLDQTGPTEPWLESGRPAEPEPCWTTAGSRHAAPSRADSGSGPTKRAPHAVPTPPTPLEVSPDGAAVA